MGFPAKCLLKCQNQKLSKKNLKFTICSIYSTEEVEPGQYVHNPEWDLTPYQVIIFTTYQYLVLFAATFTQ